MRFFTSDFHFSHSNVIRYCNRPFKDIHDMNKYFCDLWNATIKQDDIVYFLGDFSMNPKQGREWVRKLNGRKILIPGNHDKQFNFPPKVNDEFCIKATKERNDKYIKEALYDGWEAVHQSLELDLKDGTRVLLAHLPYKPKDDEFADKRYLNLRPEDKGLYLLHGHEHGHHIKKGRMIDVGIDAHNMHILNEDEVIELIKDERDFIASHITEWYKQRN